MFLMMLTSLMGSLGRPGVASLGKKKYFDSYSGEG
jgi:hypothetical protein